MLQIGSKARDYLLLAALTVRNARRTNATRVRGWNCFSRAWPPILGGHAAVGWCKPVVVDRESDHADSTSCFRFIFIANRTCTPPYAFFTDLVLRNARVRITCAYLGYAVLQKP